jgi:hypothetical protein
VPVVTWARVDLVSASGRAVTSTTLRGCTAPDLAVVDALARGQLAARRVGMGLRVHDACRELRELLELLDLGSLLADAP